MCSTGVFMLEHVHLSLQALVGLMHLTKLASASYT